MKSIFIVGKLNILIIKELYLHDTDAFAHNSPLYLNFILKIDLNSKGGNRTDQVISTRHLKDYSTNKKGVFVNDIDDLRVEKIVGSTLGEDGNYLYLF
jgi:hypothetical protein